VEPGEIENYLYAHIPLSKAMGLRVDAASFDAVELSAPLAPNINHRETAFGGSLSTLAILAAWTLLYVRLDAERIAARLAIQSNTMRYDAPATGDFSAIAKLRDAAQWVRFRQMLQRHGRARTAVVSNLRCGDKPIGEFSGEFVALIID
jgi:thioesterase domain-containing protein